MRRWVAAVLGVCAAGAAAACGRDGPAPPPEPPPRAARASEVATFTQVLVGYAVPGRPGPFTRTKEEALALATEVLRRARGGESLEELAERHTDDRDERGRPFNGASYTIARRQESVMPVVRDAVFSTRPGALCERPVDTGIAWIVLRRDP